MSGLIMKVETQFMMEMTKREPESSRTRKKLTVCEGGVFMLGVRISAEIR